MSFYENVAIERGVAGPDGSAVVALASILDIIVREDLGMGDAVNDLTAAIAYGSAVLPQAGRTFTPIGIADGFDFDGSDPEPADPIIYAFPVTANGNGEPEPLFFSAYTGRYVDKLDFTAFNGETTFAKVAAGEIGVDDGFATKANLLLVDVDSNVTSVNLASLIGREPTDLRLRENSNSVIIIDADGQAGGDLNAYYVVTDFVGNVADIQLVGIIRPLVGTLAEDHFA